MPDEAGDAVLQLVLRGEDGRRACRRPGPLGEPVDGLPGDAGAFAHLPDADEVPVVDVPCRSGGYFKMKFVVAAVRLRPPQVQGHPGAPKHGPRDAQADALPRVENADPLRPALPDGVLRQQRLVLVHPFLEGVREGPHGPDKAAVDVGRQSPDPQKAGRQAGAREGLEDVHERLPLAQGIEQRRHGPEVVGVGAEPEQVARDPLQLGQGDADVAGPPGDLDVHELFHRQDIGQVVAQGRQVVEAVGEHDDLVVRAVLGELLDAPVQKADVGAGVDDGLAVELENDAQDPVGARVLRAQVQAQGLGAHVLSIPSRGKSFRSGCPSKSSGSRMRLRSG